MWKKIIFFIALLAFIVPPYLSKATLTSCSNGTTTTYLGWCLRATPDVYNRTDMTDLLQQVDIIAAILQNRIAGGSYSTFATAAAACTGSTTELVIASTITVPSNISVSGCTLTFTGSGMLSISSSATLTYTGATGHWPNRRIFTGAGATPGVSFSGNTKLSYVTPLWWGMVCDGSTDDSNPINYAGSAINAGSTVRGGKVIFPRGKCVAANILMKQGVQWEGSGVGSTTWEGTTIIQKASSNADVFVTDSSQCASNTYLHWVQVRNLRILGDSGTNSSGNGIHHGCGTGELNIIQNVYITDMPENGIYFSGYGTNIYASDLSLSRNGTYGLNIDNSSASLGMQRCNIDRISGDNNTTALIHYHPPGDAWASCYFRDIKSETSSGTKQQDVIVLDNINGTPVYIDNLSALANSGFTLNALVRNTSTSTARIVGHGWRAGGLGTVTNLINDQNSSKTLAYSGNTNLFDIEWHSTAGIKQKNDSTSQQFTNLSGGGSTPTLSSCGTSPTISGTNSAGAITIGTGTPSACTLTFSSAYANGVACVFNDRTTAAANPGRATSVSTSAVTWTFAAATANSDVIDYICIGR